MSQLIKGSERKFILKMKPIDGVHLADCRLRVEAFVYANKVIELDDSCIKKVDEDTYKIIIRSEDAKALGQVDFKFRVHIGIPDEDFPDNYKDQGYDIIPE